MNQISVLVLPIIIATMFACKQGKLAGEKPHDQPTQTQSSNEVSFPNKHKWLVESEEKLSRWYGFHEKSIKGFKADDFVLVDTFHDVEFIELDITKLDPALAKYRLASPDGKKQLDIYGYGRQLLPTKNGQFELAAQSLDSEVALYGLAANKKLRLLFCGDACRFEDAAWVDDDLLIVAGASSDVDQKSHPMLWCIKLSTRSVFRFMHPAELAAEPKSFFNTVIVSR